MVSFDGAKVEPHWRSYSDDTVSRDAVTIAAKTHLIMFIKVSGAIVFWARVVLTVKWDTEPISRTAAKSWAWYWI